MVVNNFEGYQDLADYMVDRMHDNYYVVAVLKYDDAMGLLRELMLYLDLHATAFEIVPVQYNGYEREFYVSLCFDKCLSVEPAYKHGRYANPEADLYLVGEDVSSSIFNTIEIDKSHEVRFGVDEPDPQDDIKKKVELIKDNNGEVIGIRADPSTLFTVLFQ